MHKNEVGDGEYEDHGSRRCYSKVIMTEQTVYDTVDTCDHSYDQQCTTSYVTKYSPYQQQECKTQYKKNCYIQSGKKRVKQTVEVLQTTSQL